MTPPYLTIVWDERLATGISSVDEQHQKLFQIANRLSELHADGASLAEINGLLTELQQHTFHQFQAEADLMQRFPVGEAHRKSHLKAHQGFIKQIERACDLAAADPNAAVDLLLAFLAQWLLHHVAHMDRQMGVEIKALGGSEVSTPSQARQDSLIENLNSAYGALGDRTFGMLELNLKLQDEIERRKQVERTLNESKARFRLMADHTYSWDYLQGADGDILYMSPSCERITGYRAEEFAADPELLYRIIHPDDHHLMEDHRTDISVQEAGEEERGFRIVRKDGDTRWIIHACKALYDRDKQFIGRRGSNRDITERHSRSDSMVLVANVFESLNEAVLITDADNRIIIVNSSFSEITGYAPEEVIGMDPGVLADEVPPPELVRAQWQKMTARGRWQGEMINRRKSGELYAAWVSIDAVRDDLGDITHFVLVFSDMTERKEKDRRIHYLAHHDHLTGLPNWTLFSERMQLAVDAARSHGTQIALMFVDIDRFKQAKDRLGHDVGDLLLREFAKRMQTCLRPGDTAARIGSDEFMVLLPEIETAIAATAIADAVLHAVTQPFALDEHAVQITASIGLAIYPDHGEEVGQIMKNADLAMYQAKRMGGGTVRIYNPADWDDT
jgi:diguanylate cyclase (GGDEF)-like protein/hemerythrin-like metal-binding protein/PAS domain S-box-containing protein